MDDRAGLDDQPATFEILDDGPSDVVAREAAEAELGKHAAGLVERREDREIVDPRQLEVLGARPGRDVHDAGALVERHVVPRDHAVDDPLLRRDVVERALVLQTDELATERRAHERRIGLPRDRPPLAVLGQAVVSGRIDGRCHVRGQRPRRRRPDDERLALAPLEREPDVQRRMLELPVLPREDLVLRDGRTAAGAPHSRAMALVQPAAPVHLGKEPPDVLDVRVGERVVVAVPVHPHAEALGLLGDHLRELRDALATAIGELREAVFLDLALRVQPQRLLDLDLDPQTLAVESVLVPLVEAA